MGRGEIEVLQTMIYTFPLHFRTDGGGRTCWFIPSGFGCVGTIVVRRHTIVPWERGKRTFWNIWRGWTGRKENRITNGKQEKWDDRTNSRNLKMPKGTMYQVLFRFFLCHCQGILTYTTRQNIRTTFVTVYSSKSKSILSKMKV